MATVMKPQPHLIMFTRFPVAGECKTRLIPAVGPEGAAKIHKTLAERTADLLSQSGAPTTIAVTGGEIAKFEDWLGSDLDYALQVEGDLSKRLLAFVDDAPVIFFGSDTPELSIETVQAAIAALDTHRVVIGPAEDGGYYLIGMREPLPQLLSDMPWSTDQVLPETMRRLVRAGIEPLLLETLSDCDRPDDLPRWPWLTT